MSIEWPGSRQFSPSAEGILTSADGRFGLGAVLMMESHRTGRFLMARKSFRPGYEMNHRLTFPGGMVRSTGATNTISDCIETSLKHRVLVEVGIDVSRLESVVVVDPVPSVVATYTVHGHSVSTAIIAFHGVADHELCPIEDRQGSTYDARWRDLESIWPQVSYANGVSLAQLVWDRLSKDESHKARALLEAASRKAVEDARATGLPGPKLPWE